MSARDGGPAFPETRWDDATRQEVQWMGMTLRDYFAGRAMAGYTSSEDCPNPAKLAEWAYADADAMLKERGKK